MTILKTKSGEVIKIETVAFASGGEGRIHKIISPIHYQNFCVKIYFSCINSKKKDSQKIKEREEKIEFMVKNKPLNLEESTWKICWPNDLVYNDTNEFVGFIMPLAFDNSIELFELTNLKLNNKLESDWLKFERENTEGIKNRYKLNSNIALAVHNLHKSSQYVVVDMKPQNFLASPEGKVSILDVDSIQITNRGKVIFPSQVMTAEYLPPESKNINNNKIDISWDRFILSVMFYEILYGIHPFTGAFKPPYDNINTLRDRIEIGLFPFGNKKGYFMGIPKQHFNFRNSPKEIQNLFVDTFENGLKNIHNRPSAEAWGKTLFNCVKSNKLLAQPAESNTQTSKTIDKSSTLRIKSLPNSKIKNKNNSIIYAVITVCILISFSLFFYKKHQKTQYLSKVSEGNEFYSMARYDSALVSFKDANDYFKTDSIENKIKMLDALLPAISNFYNAKYTEAFEEFKIAAELNSGDAFYYMGELTYNGLGTVKDYKQGIEFTNKAVDLGFKMAYWRMAYTYELGKELPKDQQKADEYYSEALEVMKNLAEGGDPEALANLGSMYLNGNGVVKNEKVAFEYYLESSEKGFVFAMFILGQMYQYGLGAPKNLEKAISWYRKSADAGDPNAQLQLGNLYLNGKGVEQNVSLGLEFINNAANQNNSAALSRLGYLYFEGNHVTRDLVKSHEFTKKAIDFDNENVIAHENLAFDFKKGNGTPKNFNKAIKHYLRAVQIDSTRTDNFIKVARIYYDGGHGVTPSNSKFIEYCEIAEKRGNKSAANELGKFYFEIGLESYLRMDMEQTKYYLELASSKGHKRAEDILNILGI